MRRASTSPKGTHVTWLRDLSIRLYVRLQIFAAQEPVRLRAALLSVLMAGSALWPALGAGSLAQTLAAAGAVALPVLVGESVRSKVTPVTTAE